MIVKWLNSLIIILKSEKRIDIPFIGFNSLGTIHLTRKNSILATLLA